MANRITVILEALGFDKGAQQVKGFRQSIAEADGATGKFKAGASALGDTLKANAGPAALAAGAALVTFGVKAAQAFTDTAKAAIDLSKATGLSTEEASRWLAVGDDFEVTAEQMTTGLARVAKTLDTGTWEKYGIATRDAAGNARAANDVLIDALATLSAIPNETERARVGTELFSRGYANLAPIIGHTADEYRDMLGAVEDGQVITDKEAKKAERLRLAQDALSDAFGEVTLATGELVAGLAPAIESASELVSILMKIDQMTGVLEATANPFPDEGGKVGDFVRELAAMGETEEDLIRILHERGESERAIAAIVRVRREMDLEAAAASQEAAVLASEAISDQTRRQIAMNTAMEQQEGLADASAKAVDELRGSVDEHVQSLRDEVAAMQAVSDAMRANADSTFAVQKARDDLALSIAEVDEKTAAAQKTFDESNQTEADGIRLLTDTNAAYRDVAESAARLADAEKEKGKEFAEANGIVFTAEDQLKNWNRTMLTAAADAKGPARQAIIDFVAEANNIPAEAVTAIGAEVNEGDLDGALQTITDESAAQDAAVTVDALTDQATRDLNAWKAKMEQLLRIDAQVRGSGIGTGPTRAFADGGFTGRGSKSDIAGVVHKGEYVLSAEMVDQSTGKPKGFAGGGFAGPTIIHTTTPTQSAAVAGPSPEDAKQAADQAAREAVEREDQIQAAMYETGAISQEAYRKYVEGRMKSTQQFTSDWLEQWRTLDRLQREQAAEQQRVRDEAAAQQKKLAEEEADRQAEALKQQEEAAKATLDRIRLMYEQARALRALQDAERDVAAALDDIRDAEQDLADAEDDNDRDRAQRDLERAVQRAGEEMFAGAGARAEANGFGSGTVEWARFVRREVEAAIGAYPQLAGVLGQLLVGVPRLASGGIVKARPGGTMIIAGEGGVDEAVVPLDGSTGRGGVTIVVQGHVYGDSHLEQIVKRNVVPALKTYELANGKVFSNR